MQSAPANHASILPVFEIGSSGGTPRDLGDGAAFDELLSAPPPTCPPPPREPEPQKQTDESAQSAAPPAEASDSQPQAEATDETPQSDASAEVAKVVEENADDDDEASDTDEQSVAESLAGLAAVIPLVPPTPPVPEAEVVADAAAPAVEPAANSPTNELEGESPVVTPVTAIESPTDEAKPATAEQNEKAPAEAAAKNAESQLVPPIQEAGTDTSDGQAATEEDGQELASCEGPQATAESASDDGREDNSAKSDTAAALPTDAALTKTDQQASAKSSEAAPPPVAASETKSNASETARTTPTVSPGIEAAGGSAPRSRLPAALLAREPSGAQPATQIDSVRLLNRVARAFTAAQQRDGGEIQLRLSPAELGSLRLLIQVHEGVLSARLEAETPAARTALIDNLPALREKLAEQGVRIERFDVDLMQRQPGGMPNQPQDQERSAPPPRLVNSPRQPAPPPARPLAPRTTGPGQLNVII